MPVYNEARFIGSAIASIIAARDPLEIEIVIVDDGSSDNTAEVIESIAKTTSGIRLIRTPNRGVGHARNTLLDAIPDECDLVTFLDGDDAFAPGYLVQACQWIERDPSLDLVYGQLCLIDSDAQDMSSVSREGSMICRTISMSIGIYRPQLLVQTGQFDFSYTLAEDADYLLRLFEAGPNVFLSNEIAVLYRQHSGNATKDKLNLQRYFTRAILGHIRRRKINPELASVEGIFTISQMGGVQTNGRKHE